MWNVRSSHTSKTWRLHVTVTLTVSLTDPCFMTVSLTERSTVKLTVHQSVRPRCPSRQNKAYFDEIFVQNKPYFIKINLILSWRTPWRTLWRTVNLTVDLSVNLTVTKREPVNLTLDRSVKLTVKHPACATRNLKFMLQSGQTRGSVRNCSQF